MLLRERKMMSNRRREAWDIKLHDYKSQMSYYWYFLKITERKLKLKNMAMSQSEKKNHENNPSKNVTEWSQSVCPSLLLLF